MKNKGSVVLSLVVLTSLIVPMAGAWPVAAQGLASKQWVSDSDSALILDPGELWDTDILRVTAGSTSPVLKPTDDTFVRDKQGQRDANFDGHEDQILVTAEGFPKGVPVNVGYLRYDLSDVRGDLTAARLRLYNQVSPGPDVTLAVYGTADDDWNGGAPGLGDETTLTLNNAPAEGGMLAERPGSAEPAWVEYEGAALTAYVAEQLAGDGLVTFRLVVTSSGFVDICILEDRENGGGTGKGPQLVLEGVTVGTTIYLPLVVKSDSAGE